MAAIHLLARKDPNKREPYAYRRIGDGVQLSGWWDVSEADAAALVGGTIHLHDSKQDLSWQGGEIVGYEIAPPTAPAPDRIGFHFRPAAKAHGVRWNWGANSPNPRSEQSIVR